MLKGMGVGAALLATAPAMAAAQPAHEDRQLLSLADGEARTIGGIAYTAHGDALAILVPSPEIVSIAVLDGRLAAGDRSAGAGEALVTTTDGRTRRFGFDAARLAATLRPDWAARARPPLDRIASVQRRQRFWGRIEPIGVNAAAPRGARVEIARAMAVQATASSAEARGLEAETERLRLAIAYDVAAGIALRAPAEQDALIRALATGEGDGDLRARWFMAGAIQQPAERRRTLLFNPLAHGWLVLDWAQGADGIWQVGSARLVSSGLVSWMGGERPYLASLVADYAATRGQPGAEPGDVAGMEAGRWITGLAEFLHEPGRREAAEQARGLIARGRTGRLGGGAIDMMPARARASYAPIAGFERAEGGRSLLFGSPLYPHILIAADYDDAARPALRRLTLVNLHNVERGEAQ
jgi:hypothetical protein